MGYTRRRSAAVCRRRQRETGEDNLLFFTHKRDMHPPGGVCSEVPSCPNFARPFAQLRLQAQPLCVVVNVMTSERVAVHDRYNNAKRQGL